MDAPSFFVTLLGDQVRLVLGLRRGAANSLRPSAVDRS